MDHWYINTATLIKLSSLTNIVTGVAVTDAIITGQMMTTAEVNVGSVFTFNPTTPPTSTYYGYVPSTLSLTPGTQYLCEVTITSGAYSMVLRLLRKAAYYVQ